MVRLGRVGKEKKGFTSALVQFLVPEPGIEVDRSVFFRGVLAHSNFCQTEADVAQGEVWFGERGWKGSYEQFDVGIGCNFWSPKRALMFRQMSFLGWSLRTPIFVGLKPMWG